MLSSQHKFFLQIFYQQCYTHILFHLNIYLLINFFLYNVPKKVQGHPCNQQIVLFSYLCEHSVLHRLRVKAHQSGELPPT